MQTDTHVYGQSYVVNTSSVCRRSTFLSEPAQHDHVNYFQSFAKFCEKGLSSKIPAEKEAAIRRDPQLVEFKNQSTILKVKMPLILKFKQPETKLRAIVAAS